MTADNFSNTEICSCCGAEKLRTEFYRCKACKNGLRGECKPCVAAKQRSYNEQNAEQISEQKKRKYYAEGATVHRQKKSAAYYDANRDRLKAAARNHHTENAARISERRKSLRDKLRAQAMAWRAANRSRARATMNAWYAANKERLRPGRKAAKAMRRAAGRVDAGAVDALMVLQRGRCACCRTSIKSAAYHLDHIHPLARGGDNTLTNLQLLCPPCNLSKSAKDPVAFMQSRGFLL